MIILAVLFMIILFSVIGASSGKHSTTAPHRKTFGDSIDAYELYEALDDEEEFVAAIEEEEELW